MDYLARKGWRGVSMREHFASPSSNNICITFDDGYKNNLDLATPILQDLNFSATFFVMSNPKAAFHWHTDSPQPLLSFKDMETLAQQGHEVAAHGFSHSNLTTCSPSELKYEILEAKQVLKNVVGDVIGFAYPYGAFNQSTLKYVSEQFDYACATRYSFFKPETRWSLRRIGINYKDSLMRFKQKTTFPFRLLCDAGIYTTIK